MIVFEPFRYLEEIKYFYSCHSTTLITDSYSCELICSNCGLVIDKAEDIQIYEDTERNLVSLHSNQLSHYDMGLYTNIWNVTKDGNGHKLDTLTRSKMKRLKRLDTLTKKTSKNGILVDVFQDLDNLKHVLNLSAAVVEKTAYIYRKARDKDLIRGRSRPSMLAACLYIACREMQNNKSLEDILHATNLKKKDLSRDYRLLLFELELRSPVINPLCVAKIANLTCISEVSRREAFRAMNKMTKLGIAAGKNLMGPAASLVYLSCGKVGESITQAGIAEVAGITGMTLQNRIRDIRRMSHDIYPS
jgi:transcription initiation factor TFIIB